MANSVARTAVDVDAAAQDQQGRRNGVGEDARDDVLELGRQTIAKSWFAGASPGSVARGAVCQLGIRTVRLDAQTGRTVHRQSTRHLDREHHPSRAATSFLATQRQWCPRIVFRHQVPVIQEEGRPGPEDVNDSGRFRGRGAARFDPAQRPRGGLASPLPCSDILAPARPDTRGARLRYPAGYDVPPRVSRGSAAGCPKRSDRDP